MMRRFNLLPHRDIQQRWAQRVLGRQLLVVVLLGTGSALLVEMVLQLKDSYLTSYNNTINSAASQLVPDFRTSQDLLRQRDDMLEKQKILERLDARRSTSVLILDDLARALPQGVYLIRVEEDGEKFRLEGRSVNSGAIAHFFDSIVKSPWLANLILEEIRHVDDFQAVPYLFVINGQVSLIGTTDSSPAERKP
jgi:type IV pilus assembly protein PilN